MESVLHWLGIARWALICLWQEARGQEPDCPDCWKCESMRTLFLCSGAYVFTKMLLLLV